MGVAVEGGSAERASGVLHDPVLAVGLLDPRRRFDGLHGAAHPLTVVGAQGRLLVQPLQGVDLVEMQVGVDERLGDQAAGRVHDHRGQPLRRLLDGFDSPASHRNVVQRARAAPQPRPPDQEIEWFAHGCSRCLV